MSVQAKLAEEQEMVEEYGGAFESRTTPCWSLMALFARCIAGGAKASDEKGSAEQFDNPMHGEAAEDS